MQNDDALQRMELSVLFQDFYTVHSIFSYVLQHFTWYHYVNPKVASMINLKHAADCHVTSVTKY